MAIGEFAKGVLLNSCILLAFAALCGIVGGWSARMRRTIAPWQTGLLFGGMAVVAMLFPVEASPGILFDCRSGVIGSAALLAGPVAGLLSIPLPLAYRLYLGGGGLLPGLMEIVLPALLASLCHTWFKRGGVSLTLSRVVTSSIAVAVASNMLIVTFITIVMPASRAIIGPLGILLVTVNAAAAMALLSSLVLLEQEHFTAVESMADNERRMRHSQKMAAIGQLSRKVAHSFINALTAILGNAQLAKDYADDTPRVRESMDEIIQTVGRISNLTRELLSFANPGPLRVSRMDLSKCTSGIRELLEKAIGPNVEVVIDTDAPAGTVEVDPDQVEQAIVHMAVNAAEAIRDNGRITIRIAPARLSKKDRARLQAGTRPEHRHDGPFALLSVSDTGAGMADETCARIFEPFFTTKESRENAGLGLATVYNIVQLHKGHIDVTSRPGHGTTFSVYFPAQCAE